MPVDLATLAAVFGICLAAAITALLIVTWTRSSAMAVQLDDHMPGEPISFLLLDGQLTDLTGAASELLSCGDGRADDWTRVRAALVPRFANIPDAMPERESLAFDAEGPDDDGRLRIIANDGVVRIMVMESSPPSSVDRHLLRQAELVDRRAQRAVTHAPFPVWIADGANSVRWSNEAYQSIARQRSIDDDRPPLDTGLPLPRNDEPVSVRVEAKWPTTQDDPIWYDVTVRRSGDEWLHYATDASPIIRAEMAQRNFIQTLAKTFALLSTGLCVFDRDRRMILFNPALLELTGLSPEFLTERPSLASFFDALRDRRVMPEPKNYAGWREAISDLDSRAASGTFTETWSLPDGSTFRITGRPYPNKAVAFLFEDISAEIASSRRLHEYTAMGQSVLDTFDEAVAVFSRHGRMTMCNAAYRELWQSDPDTTVADVTAQSESQGWQAATRATPAWGDLRDFVGTFGPRAEWTADVQLKDGRPLACRFVPLPDGATLVGFTQTATAKAPRPEITA